MPIPMSCDCGRSFRIKDELAGKKIRCPQCSNVLAVPVADEVEAVEEEEPVLDVLPGDPPQREALRRSLHAGRPEERPSERGPLPDEKPKRKKRRLTLPDDRRSGDGWFENINGGIAGGLLMIVIAIIWFVGGLAVGIIFFYPPFLLVIGIIALVKGFIDAGR